MNVRLDHLIRLSEEERNPDRVIDDDALRLLVEGEADRGVLLDACSLQEAIDFRIVV